MSESRPPPLRVAFVGFSDFERHSLASYFRLTAEREQRYELVKDVALAELLVADADHAPSVQLIEATERLGETVFIGSQAPPGATGSMRRPIDALHVMRALDGLANRDPLPNTWPDQARGAAPAAGVVGPAAVPAAASVTPSPSPEPLLARAATHALPTSEAAPGQPAPAQAPKPAPAPAPAPAPTMRWPARPAPAVRRPSGPSALTARRPAPPRPAVAAVRAPALVGPPPPPRALLVDDSRLALRFLASRLTPWCVRVDTAGSSGEALELLAQRAYDFVFLDLELGAGSELDGLGLCRQIKRNELALSALVVMVSAHHSEVDRARGALAGCDGYLSKPLNEGELATLLRRQGLVAPAVTPSFTAAE
jgi:CheY-like chemotaxis protein